jgi:hypothetical protein
MIKSLQSILLYHFLFPERIHIRDIKLIVCGTIISIFATANNRVLQSFNHGYIFVSARS